MPATEKRAIGSRLQRATSSPRAPMARPISGGSMSRVKVFFDAGTPVAAICQGRWR
jgi:hypothetical protein